MDADQLEQVVEDRSRGLIRGRYRSASAILETAIRCFNPRETDLQPVRWDGALWSSKTEWHERTRARVEALRRSLGPSGDRDCEVIRRRDVFDRARDPADLFLAAMAWGFGKTGYGWWRTAQMVNPGGRDCEDRIAEAIESYRSAFEQGGPEAVARAWSRGVGKVAGLGPAFASKLAYFACYDRAVGAGPLIDDINTAWSLWALNGAWDSRGNPGDYAAYVGWSQREAQQLGCRSDDVERALFAIGPGVRRIWHRLRS